MKTEPSQRGRWVRWAAGVLAASGIMILSASCGRQTAPPNTEAFKVLGNDVVQSHVNTVLNEVAAASGSGPYSLVLYDTDIVQAFALPGDKVALTRGMLNFIQTDAELACVLGHEIAHHVMGHVDRKFGSDPPPPVGKDHPLITGWPLADEDAADSYGVGLCAGANYDPIGAAHLLYRVARPKAAQLETGLLPQNSTEPSWQRVVHVLEAIKSQGVKGGRIGAKSYIAVHDGLPSSRFVAPVSPDGGLPFLTSKQLYEGYNLLRSWDQIQADAAAATKDWIDTQCSIEGNNTIPTNYVDSFGHCWFGCEVARVTDGDFGNPGIWHEIDREFFSGGEHDSFWQDWRNQNEGNRHSGEEGSCFAVCESLITAGKLDLTAPERKWWDCDTGEYEDERPQDAKYTRYGDTVSPHIFGDPHLVTGDGLRYDFQAVGDYVAMESTTDDLAVQVRLSRVAALNASKTTAVAMNVHGDRVTAYVDEGRLLARVNGTTAAASGAWVTLPQGGRTQADAHRLAVRWKDGTALWVSGFGGVLGVTMDIPAQRHAALGGLFGNFDGDAGNEHTTRDGRRLKMPDTPGAARRSALYGEFGQSWKVEAAETLFDPDAGLPPGTTDAGGFPTAEHTPTDAERAAARARCLQQGVPHGIWLEACIYDFALTGDLVYAQAAARAADPRNRATNPMFQTDLMVDGGPTHPLETFFGRKGQRQFFRTSAVASGVRFAKWEVIGPDGTVLFSRCVHQCNQPGAYTLPATGRYVSRFVATQGERGAVSTVRNLIPPPQIFKVARSQELAGSIGVPGEIHVYRFAATPGANLSLAVTERDRRLVFGRWKLVDPSGASLFDTLLPTAALSTKRVTTLEEGIYVLSISGGESWPAGTDYGHGAYRINLEGL